jgi:hypothetical protein
MIQLVTVEARPPGMCFPILREGEKISGGGLAGFGGDAGRMKCGRCDVAGAGVWAIEAGVRGADTLKREWWKAMGDEGAARDSGDIRRRFAQDTVSKSSSSSLGDSSKSVGSCSVEGRAQSCVCSGLDCEGSSMLSTRSSFLGGFECGVACESPQASFSFSALIVCRGAITKRLAGVIFLNCNSGFGIAFFAGARA